jgi:hypothetical protein
LSSFLAVIILAVNNFQVGFLLDFEQLEGGLALGAGEGEDFLDFIHFHLLG